MRRARECRWVEVPCEQCGKAVRRREQELIQRKESGKYSGRIFCDRACFAAFRRGRLLGKRGAANGVGQEGT